jgi:integrase
MAYRLTDKTLRKLLAEQQKAPPPKRRKEVDGEGLYIAVEPSGALLWRYKFRFGGVEKEMALGRYDGTPSCVSLGKARDLHKEAKALLKNGINPIEHKKAAANLQTNPAPPAYPPFGTAADGWLKTRRPAQAAALDERQTRKRFKTYDRDARMVQYLKDGKETAKGFAGLEITSVDYAANLLPLLNVCNQPTRIRLTSAARKIIAYAKAQGLFPKDRPSPFADIDFSAGFAKHKVRHRPAITDPTQFGALLRSIDGFQGRVDNLTKYALQLLALTFVRPGTLAAAKWAHFNLKGAIWVIPFQGLKMATQRQEAGKSEDDYIVPLSRQAVTLLEELHKITGDQQYLFPSYGEADTISENTINFALHALGYQDIHCGHGFRSTASTLLNRERIKGRRRFEKELIEMQQDRLDASTRAVYDRDDRLPERIELMQFWADMIDRLRGSPALKLVA